MDYRSDTLMISLVLPIHNQADHVSRIVAGYLNVMRHLSVQAEIMLVANGCTDGSPEMCRYLEECHRDVHAFELRKAGWGHAVRTGLANARGDILGYTNSARTDPKDVFAVLALAQAHAPCLAKVRRIHRGAPLRLSRRRSPCASISSDCSPTMRALPGTRCAWPERPAWARRSFWPGVRGGVVRSVHRAGVRVGWFRQACPMRWMFS